MSDIDRDIQKLIAEKLPGIHVQHLTSELNALKLLRAEVMELRARLDKADELLKVRGHAIDAATTELAKHSTLSAREASVSQRENKIEIELLALQLKMEKETNGNLHRLCETVFKNKHITYSTYGSVPVRDSNGYISTHSTSSTTTVLED